MNRFLAALACAMVLLFGGASLAQDPVIEPGETVVSPEVFDAYSVGTTITYHRFGEFYGAEQHFPNREVRWLRQNGTCSQGTWRAVGDVICFSYRDEPGVEHCLQVIDNDKGRVHRFLGNLPEEDLVIVGQSREPLRCTGPEVGVSYQPRLGHDADILNSSR